MADIVQWLRAPELEDTPEAASGADIVFRGFLCGAIIRVA
jgi:hypothetical protein